MYVKTTNGSVDQYPYTIGQLRRDNPSTSFPKNIPDTLLADYGVYPVTNADAPDYDANTHKLIAETSPSLVDGNWVIGHSTEALNADELAAAEAYAQGEVRGQRDNLLALTDHWAYQDTPDMTDEQIAYRQALRDITSQEGFPFNVTWPTKPE